MSIQHKVDSYYVKSRKLNFLLSLTTMNFLYETTIILNSALLSITRNKINYSSLFYSTQIIFLPSLIPERVKLKHKMRRIMYFKHLYYYF